MSTDLLKIVVHDKAASCCETFVCNAAIIENNMRYFAPVIRDHRLRGGPMSISVNCDVEIFRWLVLYVMSKSPSITIANVVSLILSSDFLGIARLRSDSISYFGAHIVDVVMSDVNLDHINDSVLVELVQGLSFGALCDVLVKLQSACLGITMDEIAAGVSPKAISLCPNRQFVSRLLYCAVSVLTEQWCSSFEHSVVQCSSCRRYFSRVGSSTCSNSTGVLDARGFISSNHVPGSSCLCKAELPPCQAVLASPSGKQGATIYHRALHILERKEESAVRAFLSPKEALCVIFLATHVPTTGGETLWESRTCPSSPAISPGHVDSVKCLLASSLPVRADRVNLGELRGERFSNPILSPEGEVCSGWSSLESDWVCQRLGTDDVPNNDPEQCAQGKVNTLTGLIDQHERSVLFVQGSLASVESRVVKPARFTRRTK